MRSLLLLRIADSLGALFSLFGAQFFAMLPAVLRRCNATKTSQLFVAFCGILVEVAFFNVWDELFLLAVAHQE